MTKKNAIIANKKQVDGYDYNAKSLRDGTVTPKTVGLDYNGSKSVQEAAKLGGGRNKPFKASAPSIDFLSR